MRDQNFEQPPQQRQDTGIPARAYDRRDAMMARRLVESEVMALARSALQPRAFYER